MTILAIGLGMFLGSIALIGFVEFYERFIEKPDIDPAVKYYEVWLEGYIVTGQQAQAQRLTRKNELTLWPGKTFKEAVRSALTELKWNMSCYDGLTYWGCRFFDNEADARKSFG